MSASLSLFEKEHAAREKYSYFICGVSGALTAYLGKDYTPNDPWTARDTLTISTLACLIISFTFGIFRILLYIQGMSINREVLVAEEDVANLHKSVAFHLENEGKGTPLSMSSKTGTSYTKQELIERRDQLIVLKNKKTPQMRRWHFWSTAFLVICHIFLFAGFILLVLSKLFNSAMQ